MSSRGSVKLLRAQLVAAAAEKAQLLSTLAELQALALTHQHARDELAAAIKRHRDQRGDDRCWLDDEDLYAALPGGEVNTALPPREEFLANCARFHASRQAPGAVYETAAAQVTAERARCLHVALVTVRTQPYAETSGTEDIRYQQWVKDRLVTRLREALRP